MGFYKVQVWRWHQISFAEAITFVNQIETTTHWYRGVVMTSEFSFSLLLGCVIRYENNKKIALWVIDIAISCCVLAARGWVSVGRRYRCDVYQVGPKRTEQPGRRRLHRAPSCLRLLEWCEVQVDSRLCVQASSRYATLWMMTTRIENLHCLHANPTLLHTVDPLMHRAEC